MSSTRSGSIYFSLTCRSSPFTVATSLYVQIICASGLVSTKVHKHTELLRHHHLKKKTEIKREKGQHILSTSKSWRLYHTSLSWCKETVGDVQWLDAKGPKIKDDIQLHCQLADHNNKIDNGPVAFEAYILTRNRGQQKPQP